MTTAADAAQQREVAAKTRAAWAATSGADLQTSLSREQQRLATMTIQRDAALARDARELAESKAHDARELAESKAL